MAYDSDNPVFFDFIREAKSYLPTIRAGIDAYISGGDNKDKLQESHRYLHTIKGGAAMLGITGLRRITSYPEEAMDEFLEGKLDLTEGYIKAINESLDSIEKFIDGLLNDNLVEEPIITKVTNSFRILKGLPLIEEKASAEEIQVVEAIVEETEAVEAISEEVEAVEAVAEELEAMAAEDEIPEAVAKRVGRISAEDEASLQATDQSMIPAELLETFALEAEDHMQNISRAMGEFEKTPENKELMEDIRRSVHTIKGSAGVVGLRALSRIAHRMEDMLDLLYEDEMDLDQEKMNLLFASADTIEDMIGGEVNIDTLRNLYITYSAILDTHADAEPEEEAFEEQVIDLSEIPGVEDEEADEQKSEPERKAAGEVVRVPLERLDEIVRLLSELVINRSAYEQRLIDLNREVDEFKGSVERLHRATGKLETQYEISAMGGGVTQYVGSSAGAGAGAEGGVGDDAVSGAGIEDFDELEFDRYTEFHHLTRELIETTSDIRSVGSTLTVLIGEFHGLLDQQGRLSNEMQEKLMAVRMVPLATIVTRLSRTVRVVARDQGKLVDLEFFGENIELDKTVLEQMVDPLMHLLRNAVDHGIEPAELRAVSNKPDRGKIQVRAYREGNQIVIRIQDDGSGLKSDLIRAKAIKVGLITEGEAKELSDKELHPFIFTPGFSTAEKVSEVSGRGVGMDVVKTNITKLKGTVSVESTPGEGTTIIINLPMTLAVMQSLLIKEYNTTFAVPLAVVSQIFRMEKEKIEKVGQEKVLRVAGKVYPMVRLGETLDLKGSPDESVERYAVLILDAGAEQVALVVDHLIGGQEIVIKTLGSHLRRVHGLTGATLMGDGSVVLIINPIDLVTAPETRRVATMTPVTAEGAEARKTFTVMIVDDSLSVRRVMTNLFKNIGWNPVIAKDGVEALEMLQRGEVKPDAMTLDIEMPRMDGYELLATLRSQDEFKSLPIIMLTSRAGDKHRKKAIELGVSEYVVKPYQDESLIGIIRRLVLSQG